GGDGSFFHSSAFNLDLYSSFHRRLYRKVQLLFFNMDG
ncbi:MAG: hypothetical protein ACI8VT_004501, partial [Saprospiraceae bacterium]